LLIGILKTTLGNIPIKLRYGLGPFQLTTWIRW